MKIINQKIFVKKLYIIELFIQFIKLYQKGLVCRHTTPPYALAWTPFGILVGGCDKRIVVYTKDGKMLQQFDYSKESTEKEFTVAACNPSGQIAVVGSFNRYFKFKKKHYCKSNQ